MQDPQRRHGARLHRKGTDWHLRTAPRHRIRLPALSDMQHPWADAQCLNLRRKCAENE
jgi:hypothetical protein